MIGRRPWMRRRSGFGAVDCTGWAGWFNPSCWNVAGQATQIVAAGGRIATTSPTLPPMSQPPAVGIPASDLLTKAPASGTEASQTVSNILTQQMAAWQAQNQAYFDQLAALQNQAGAPGAPDCTSVWTYYTNSACPPDCSRFWTNLTNSSCPGIFGGGSAFLMPLAIAAGVLLLVVVIRR